MNKLIAIILLMASSVKGAEKGAEKGVDFPGSSWRVPGSPGFPIPPASPASPTVTVGCGLEVSFSQLGSYKTTPVAIPKADNKEGDKVFPHSSSFITPSSSQSSFDLLQVAATQYGLVTKELEQQKMKP